MTPSAASSSSSSTLLTNLLLLSSTLSLLPHASAYRHHEPETRQGVRWLQEETSVLVRLNTPDLPLWNPELRIGELVPSAFILNFTLQDRRVLLLNDVPIFPLTNAFVPPKLHAPQAAISLPQFEHGALPDVQALSSFELDYWREVVPAEHADSHHNTYDPTLKLDILGAGIAGYNTLLDHDKQRFLAVRMNEVEPDRNWPYDKPISQRSYVITDVVIRDRFPYNEFSPPEALKQCRIWSWICSDFDEYPWYLYVYRGAFDQYGKIGSLRHFFAQRYDVACQKLGARQATFLVVIGILAVLSIPGYGVVLAFRRLKASFEGSLREYRREQMGRYEMLLQAEEEEERMLDCDIETALDGKNDQLVERSKEVEASKPLPPLPHQS